jgi:hypothetical protein
MGEEAADEFDFFEKGGARVGRRREVSHQGVVQRIWKSGHSAVRRTVRSGKHDREERIALD